MALFKPYKITSDKLADLPVREGQIIVTTDTHRLFVDVSATERMEVTSDAEVDLTDYVTTTMLTSALGEEASEREKQDNLLDNKIDTKLDTTQADDRYALKDNPKLTGNASITGGNWLSAKITGAHSNGEIEDYYKYVIGFDALHRPYIGRKEGEDTVSMIYLDTDKIVFNKPLAFTGSSGLESGNAEAAAQTRQNIGAAAIEHTHDVATIDSAGFMSAEDKTTLDGLAAQDLFTKDEADELYAAIDHNHDDRYYTESEVDSKLSAKADATHTHTIGQVDNLQETLDGLESDLAGKANATHIHDDRYFTETEVTDKLAAKADTGHKHAASDVTSGTFSLDRIPTITDAKISGLSASKLTGTIPTANLPSYVDDVVEGETTADFPETGEAGKIYVATSTNKTYRWGGSGYVEISASLALGTTSSTAFRGDYGNTAYQHATAKGSAFASGLYKITTNAQGHVTAATAVTKNDITALGIPAQDTNTNTTYTLSKSGSTITLSGSDGNSTSVTDANTTYSLGSFGITATAAELNKLDGVTATATELNYVDGVTSNIQTQLNGKAASSHSHSVASTSAAGFLPKLGGGTTNYLRADGTWAKPPDTNTTYTLSSFGITATAAELNKLDGVTTTATQLNYLNTLTGNVQTQLNGKAASSHSHDGTYTRIYNLGIQAFGGNQNGITTAQFLTLLNGYGAFSDKSWITRGSWSYASNQYIKDTGCGNIHLAGCTVEVMGTSTTNCTIRIHTPTTSSSGVSNGDFIYINNGPEYTPGWRRLYSTKYKPTAADIGAAASSHTHSYLPLSGGTLTGTLTARTITPSADSTYNIGSSTVRYANIYADTFTGALSGNATSATSAAYWTTARTLSFTGDVTGSVSVRGNANMSCALTIGSGKVGTAELATDAVTSAKIAANAVTASEIASGAVGLSELSSAVGTVAVQSATPTDSHVKLWIKV